MSPTTLSLHQTWRERSHHLSLSLFHSYGHTYQPYKSTTDPNHNSDRVQETLWKSTVNHISTLKAPNSYTYKITSSFHTTPKTSHISWTTSQQSNIFIFLHYIISLHHDACIMMPDRISLSLSLPKLWARKGRRKAQSGNDFFFICNYYCSCSKFTTNVYILIYFCI